MTEKDLTALASIRSATNYLETDAHEVNLQAVRSEVHSLGDVAVEFTSEQKFFILKRLNFEGLVSLDNLPLAATFMLEKVQSLKQEESVKILKEYLIEHEDDVNIPIQEYEFVEKLIDAAPNQLGTPLETTQETNSAGSSTSKVIEEKQQFSEEISSLKSLDSTEAQTRPIFELYDWDLQVRLEAAVIAYHSPYPEVRSVTDPYDDPSIPVETVRAYLAGLIWLAIETFVDQFFSQRMPSISLSSSVVQIFLYPTGLLLAYVLPDWKIKVWKYTIPISPGPWNFKEQMLATIMVESSGVSYVSSNIHVQRLKMFYDNSWANTGYEILLMLCTNCMGFGLAGIIRSFAVYNVRAVWPTIMPTLALNRALLSPEKKEIINGWSISRYNWFFLVASISFLYFWVPNYLLDAFHLFNWLTWIKPDSFNLAAITGAETGLGLNPIPSFDWNVISGGALYTPFYSYVNQYIGSVFGLLCIVGVYYTNHYWSGFLPINSNSLFTNTGEYYAVTEVVNEKSLFDEKKYEAYGPPFYTAANLVMYGTYFALYPFSFVYEIGIRYKQIYSGFRSIFRSFTNLKTSSYDNFHDPHSRMMARYKEVPEWCFLLVLIISLVLAIICVQIYPAETPVWAIFFALGLSFVFLVPFTILYSITGFSIGLNVLTELIIGYAIPGNGLALNFIKALGVNIDGQAQNYISSQKMCHYVKIPPRAFFRAQLLSVIVNSFIGIAVLNFTLGYIKGYCLPGQPQLFTCPDARTFYSASVIWGVIGPRKTFQLYPELKYCFLIGFVLALLALAFKYYGPKRMTRYFEPSLVIGGMLIYAPYNLSYQTGGLYLSIASMYFLRKRYTTWWEKYNYIFSGAMDAGVAFSSVIIFFAVQYHDKSISWWGNNVNYQGVDAMGLSRLNATELAPDGYFGPRVGHFPQ